MLSTRRLLAFAAVSACITLVSPFVTTPAASANPPVRDSEWYINRLKLPQAQELSTGKGIIVAVVDTGVDGTQRDLAGNVLPGIDLTDPGSNGWHDTNGHGTSMAGIIAAKGGDQNHALGMAPGSRILPIKIGSGTDITDDAEAQGIRTAVDKGAKIINLSVGKPGPAPSVIIDAVKYALDHEAILISAAGNRSMGETAIINPANVPGVIAVTGVGKNGYFWSNSVAGAEAGISAPAEDIVTSGSTSKYDNGYAENDGTSCAAAFVSGLAALVWAKYPNLDANNVINRILKTATDGGEPGRDSRYGYGGLNVMKALTASVPAVSRNPLLPEATATPTATTGQRQASDSAAAPTSGGISPLVVVAIVAVLLVIIAVFIGLLVRASRRRTANALFAARSPAGPPPTGPGEPTPAPQQNAPTIGRPPPPMPHEPPTQTR